MRKICVVVAALMVALVCASVCCAQRVRLVEVPAKTIEGPLPVIEGTVVDGNGKPIRKAKVLGLTHLTNRHKPVTEKLPVDSNGLFTFRPKGRSEFGYYSLIATADGYACGGAGFRVGDTEQIKITLRPGYTLKGKVVDEKGRPLPGTKVEVTSCRGDSRGSGNRDSIPGNVAGLLEAVTGKDGTFAIRRLLRPSDYEQFYVSLSVSKKGRATIDASFSSRDSKDEITRGVTVKQPVGCVVEGVFYLPGKAGPVPAGMSIAVQVPSEYGSEPRIGKTDKAGKFRIDALPSGKLTVLLGPPEYRRDKDGRYTRPEGPPWVLRATERNVKPKEVARLELVAEPGAVVKGKVAKKDGEPAAQAYLAVQDASGRSVGVSTNDKGEFTARVASGDVRIMVQRFANSYFLPEEAPSVELKVADGEVKTDVVLTVVVESQVPRFDYGKASKAIPDDFDLKPGTYELTWDPDLDCESASQSYSRISSDEIKPKIKGNPQLKSAKARYFACRFDGSGDEGCLVMVLDESKGDGKGYDTAYVDLNRNWDLSDEKPITFTAPRNYNQLYTEEFSVPLRQRGADGQVSERPVQARLAIYGDGKDYIQASVARKGAWKGAIESNKGKVECAVLDDSCNGVCGEITQFKDNGEPGNEGDHIFIDTNGAGSVIPYPYGSHGVGLYTVTRVGSRYYNISVSSLGDKVTVEPYRGETGSLLVRGTDIEGLKADAESVDLIGACGYYQIKGCAGKAVTLPVGKYRISSCALLVKSANSRTLNMGCSLNSPVEVKPNAQTGVDIGGKLSMAINPDAEGLTWKPGESADLNWVIRLGNNVTINSIGDRNSSNSPKVKFFTSKGKLKSTVDAGYT